jgi:hypothetical protein
MVTLFADRQSNWEPVSRGRKRTSGVRGVSTRRIFQVVEVENELAFAFDAVRWQWRIQKPTSGIGHFRAGQILENEKQLCALRVFQNRLEPIGLSLQGELRVTRNWLIVARSRQRD